MLKNGRKFLSKVIVCVMALFLVISGGFCETNVPSGDIGDYGSWATEHNRDVLTSTLRTDLENAAPHTQPVSDYVPPEAKVGLAFIGGLSTVGKILDSSLIRFVNIFLILAYIFWAMFESYRMMTTDSNVKKLMESLVKKAVLIAVWIFVLAFGPAKIFMMVIGPIIMVGTYLSNLILDSVTGLLGVKLPDTCQAIHNYVAARPDTAASLINPEHTAEIMCVPTRLSGFFATAISVGWKWMIAGIGTSAFTFFVGAFFIVLFAFNIWKFAFMAFGVIADLFLAVLLLPFTAISETIGKTEYKGIAGDIFNGFLGLFKTESLNTQIQRFVNAAIYFVSLSIVIAICAGLLAGTVTPEMGTEIPTLQNVGFMTTLLTGLLVAYLATHADKIARDIGGSVNPEFGEKLRQDVIKLWTSSYEKINKLRDQIKNNKK